MRCLFAAFSVLILIAGCNDDRPVAGRYPAEGLASWYTAARTATGERFDGNSLTCAMRRRDFGKYYKVCNRDNNRCVIVRQNNFGPSAKMFKRGRIIDLSRGAFSSIADLKDGVIRVSVFEEP